MRALHSLKVSGTSWSLGRGVSCRAWCKPGSNTHGASPEPGAILACILPPFLHLTELPRQSSSTPSLVFLRGSYRLLLLSFYELIRDKKKKKKDWLLVI